MQLEEIIPNTIQKTHKEKIQLKKLFFVIDCKKIMLLTVERFKLIVFGLLFAQQRSTASPQLLSCVVQRSIDKPEEINWETRFDDISGSKRVLDSDIVRCLMKNRCIPRASDPTNEFRRILSEKLSHFIGSHRNASEPERIPGIGFRQEVVGYLKVSE